MEWDELDLDRARWRIPAERMKGGVEHDVPLVPEGVSLLHAIHEIRAMGGRLPWGEPVAETRLATRVDPVAPSML